VGIHKQEMNALRASGLADLPFYRNKCTDGHCTKPCRVQYNCLIRQLKNDENKKIASAGVSHSG
jgi:hypothetical protein